MTSLLENFEMMALEDCGYSTEVGLPRGKHLEIGAGRYCSFRVEATFRRARRDGCENLLRAISQHVHRKYNG